MVVIDVEKQDQSLRREADALLARYAILAILERYGKPHLTGSYSLQLMTWRDLDIYLEMPAPETVPFLELGRQLGEALLPRKLSFTDHLNFPTTEAVTGLYWGIQTGVLSRGGWKIDVWGVTPAVCSERLAHCDSLRARLDVQTRLAVLSIKHEICRLPEYRKTITSQHIYDAVLQGGARSVADFWRYFLSRMGEQTRSAG